MINGGVIAFFYVDDIVICYRKKDEVKVKAATAGLQARYAMNELGDLKWFLGIHVLRDRAKRLLWLSQEFYIDKIANQFNVDITGKMPDTPMVGELLLKTDEEKDDEKDKDSRARYASIHAYQKKTGSILFAAIITRPDISFAISRLARFNIDPGVKHHQAADRVIQYLYGTKGMAI
jgi:hypothetical protein